VLQVSIFARHFNKSPEVLGLAEIRSYHAYLTNEKKLAVGSIFIAISALLFRYKVTFNKSRVFNEIIQAPKKPRKLPVVLSPEYVFHFLQCLPITKHWVILIPCYAVGLCLSEAICLKPHEALPIRASISNGLVNSVSFP
jgi:integrase/recombinase XerD